MVDFEFEDDQVRFEDESRGVGEVEPQEWVLSGDSFIEGYAQSWVLLSDQGASVIDDADGGYNLELAGEV